MTDHRDFLVELGTEELPPKALSRLSEAFGAGIKDGLEKAGIDFGSQKLFAAPRRLAVWVKDVAIAQPNKAVERRGPALTAAFKPDGMPTGAALGFAKSCGIALEQLETLKTEQGSWLVHKSVQSGLATAQLLPGIVEQSLAKLPIPKRMRWGNYAHEFVRPVHWIVMLLGEDIVDCEILGRKSGRETRGHRFHAPHKLAIPQPSDYAALLEMEGHVLADFDRRRDAIRAQVEAAALDAHGHAVIDPALLDEVTGLVEWPRVIVGNFERKFLEVPAEAIISAMKGHQKYFHMLDSAGNLLPNFIAVTNIESKNKKSVCKGNERVIRPRLADADFFWTQDKKTSLAERVDSLRSVVFQTKLGTVHDKTLRVRGLAGEIAKALSANVEFAQRAAELSKCDLMTKMVGEFPELQGIMGEYYARADGENGAVAVAIREQYLPRFGGDVVPSTTSGQALAIADKLDTLVGIFGIGQPPTGDKDPFALRRAALGIQRIVIENRLPLNLRDLVNIAAGQFQGLSFDSRTAAAVYDFMMERLRGYYSEQGLPSDVFDAVLAVQPAQPFDFDRRMHAVAQFRQLPQAESLAAANKRIRNILKKTEETIPSQIDASLFAQAEEQRLFERLEQLATRVGGMCQSGDYAGALGQLAQLKEPVDQFFDGVMVMVDDPTVRKNRLALLNRLGSLFLDVADISRLHAVQS